MLKLATRMIAPATAAEQEMKKPSDQPRTARSEEQFSKAGDNPGHARLADDLAKRSSTAWRPPRRGASPEAGSARRLASHGGQFVRRDR
jgi:hypothetical protein